VDSGAGTLRAEIAAAHNGDTLLFAPSLNGQTITLTSGELLIKDRRQQAQAISTSAGQSRPEQSVFAAPSWLIDTNRY